MKKIYLIMSLLAIAVQGYTQCSVTVVGSTNVSCNGLCDGSVTLSSVGVPNFTYSWSPGGQTIQNPSDLCVGSHTVTMTDANSCVSTATVVITEPAPLQDSATVTNASCNGNCNGSIDLHPYGGTIPYTYSWAPNGEFTEDLLALCAGTYSVTITDGNNCTTNDDITVAEPAVLAVSTTTYLGCGTNCDKTATAMPSGGTSPYSYIWTPSSQSTQTATGLCAGTHQVNILDANGCSTADTIIITNPADLTVSTSSTNSTCWACSDGSVSAVASGGTGSYIYSWSPGGCVLATCNTLTQGTYTVIVTDGNGCSDTASQVVSSPTGINETSANTNINCYPNPFNETLSIEFNLSSMSKINLGVFNLIGDCLLNESITGNTFVKNISLKYLDPGIYFLKMEINGENYSEIIIRQ